MSKPKLLSLIQGLDEEELISLRKYMLTKTGPTSETFCLFDLLLKHRHKTALEINIAWIVKNWFPLSSIKTISNYLSVLFSWTEEWIIKNQLDLEEFTSDLLVMKWLNRKGQYHLANQTARRIERKLNDLKALNIESSKAKFEMLSIQLISNNPYKYENKQERLSEMVMSYLDYVKCQNLIFKAELNNWGNISNHDYTVVKDYLNHMNDHIRQSDTSMLLEALIKLIEESDVTAYFFLREQLFENKIELKSELHYIVATYCINRSSRLWARGQINHPKIIAQMFEYGLTSGVLLNNGKIQSATFHNLVIQLTQSLSFEEVVAFIDKWLPKVNTNNFESTRALAMGQICFYFKKYREIFHYTWRSDFETFNQKNIAQGLFLMAAFIFRNEDRDLFHNTLKSSLNFIKRNKKKMSQHIYDSYFNLFDFISKYDKNMIGHSSLNYSPIMYKMWCEGLLKELDLCT